MNNREEKSSVIDLDLVNGLMIVTLIVLWVLSGVLMWKSPDKVPLFFSKPYGRDQLASKWWLSLYPSLSLIIYLFSFLTRKNIKSSDISISMTAWVSYGSLILLLLSEIFVATLIF